ncbi:MAG: cache domain-containing protein, partial [Pseudomonadota bacterium]
MATDRTHMFRPVATAIAAFVALALVVTAGVWAAAVRQGVEQQTREGRVALTLAADRLSGQLRRFREAAVLLADHPHLIAALSDQADAARAERLLRQVADKTGALDLAVLDAKGLTVASATGAPLDARGLPSFQRAMTGALGRDREVAGGVRVFHFAAPIFAESGPAMGAVMVTIDMGLVEDEWRGGGTAVYFTDEDGVIFVTNRSELLLRQTAPGPLLGADTWQIGGVSGLRLEEGPYIPARA